MIFKTDLETGEVAMGRALPIHAQTWIATAVAAAGALVGGIIKSRTARKANQANQAELDRQKAENEAYYNRRYYEDGTQRADVRRVLTEAGEKLRRDNQAASGRAAVMGSTNAEVAAAKEANNEAYADMVSRAAAAAEARKDAVEDNYLKTRTTLHGQQISLDQQRSADKQAAISTAAEGLAKAAESYEAANYDDEK